MLQTLLELSFAGSSVLPPRSYWLPATSRLLRRSEYSAEGHADRYTIGELLVDVRSALFAEQRGGKTPDGDRRALQRSFVENLILKLSPSPVPSAGSGATGVEARPVMEALGVRYSDLYPAVRAELFAPV